MNKYLKSLILVSILAVLVITAACGAVPVEEVPAATAAPTAAPTPTPEPTPPPTPVPTDAPGRAAALGLPTPPDIDITSWEYKFCNYYVTSPEYNYELGENFTYCEGQGIDKRVEEQLEGFLKAARDAGYRIYIAAGVRNYDWLKTHYTEKAYEVGTGEEAAKIFLPPGCNEHQLGLAVDITENGLYVANFNPIHDPDIENSDAFKWACEHCAEFGFIRRYPEGKEEYYGYTGGCTGHFRYVGVEAATYIMENNLCLEEFLALYTG